MERGDTSDLYIGFVERPELAAQQPSQDKQAPKPFNVSQPVPGKVPVEYRPRDWRERKLATCVSLAGA
jgi:hypothetical protein